MAPHFPRVSVQRPSSCAPALHEACPTPRSHSAHPSLYFVLSPSSSRWRFTCKWDEEEAATKKKKPSPKDAAADDPVLPSCPEAAATGTATTTTAAAPAAGSGAAGLVADLVQAGMMRDTARDVAGRLAGLSRGAAAAVAKRRHQLASGRAAGAAVSDAAVAVAFHRRSVDLSAGGHFVKVGLPVGGEPCQGET